MAPQPKNLRPKKKCCADRPRCQRCPIRLLSEGNLDPAEAKKIFAKARNRKELKRAGSKDRKLVVAA